MAPIKSTTAACETPECDEESGQPVDCSGLVIHRILRGIDSTGFAKISVHNKICMYAHTFKSVSVLT